MIKSITFKTDWRCFSKGDIFEFHPGVNLLVGDQGTGKSSLITLITWATVGRDKTELNRVAEVAGDQGTQTFMHDFEKDNYRTRHGLSNDAIGFQLAAHFQSHGEVVNAMLAMLKEIKDHSTAVVDEPDMALSIRSAHKLVELFKSVVVGEDRQVIATIHNPIIMANFALVLSLEHKRWMPSQEFIDSQADVKGAKG